MTIHLQYATLKPSKRGTARPPTYKGEGGDSMTALEIIGLLNLIAVVVFGVIQALKK